MGTTDQVFSSRHTHRYTCVLFSILSLEAREGLEHTRQTLIAEVCHQLIAAFLLVILGFLILISMVITQVYTPTSGVYRFPSVCTLSSSYCFSDCHADWGGIWNFSVIFICIFDVFGGWTFSHKFIGHLYFIFWEVSAVHFIELFDFLLLSFWRVEEFFI